MMDSARVRALRFWKLGRERVREWPPLGFWRLDGARVREWLPLLALLVGLASMFVFGGDRGHYYRPGVHDGISSQSMALAANLSPEHNFLMFFWKTESSYEAYNRYPIGTYVLLKLGILPFGDDLSAQIWVGRLLTMLLTAAGAVSAYLALRRITGSGWIASAAVMATFSSYYFLYYNDFVSTEVISVFGILLTFHGMVVFVQDGRFRQLIIKTCAGVLLGWHVMALVLPFVVIGAAAMAGAYSSSSAGAAFVERARLSAVSALSCRYVRYGAMAGVFCALVMAFNVVNEYFALGREVPLTRLPMVESYIARLGIDDRILSAHASTLAWGPYLRGQVSRVGGMSTPYFVDQRRKGKAWSWSRGAGGDSRLRGNDVDVGGNDEDGGGDVRLSFALQGMDVDSRLRGNDVGVGRNDVDRVGDDVGVGSDVRLSFGQQERSDAGDSLVRRAALPLTGLAGAFVLAVGAVGVFFMRHKLLTGTLLLAGWCWVIPLRTAAGTHEFEALFHVGAPLIFFASGLLLVRWLVRREWVIGVLAVGAVGVFVLSSFEMSGVGHGAESALFQEAVMQDFEVIRGMTAGEDVVALLRSKDDKTTEFAGAAHAVNHYLGQRSRSLRYEEVELAAGGYTIMRERIDTPALLTPGNRYVFLYDSDGLMDMYRTAYESVISGDPIARGSFDVYLHEGALYYVKEGCDLADADIPFFLHIVPANEDALPVHRRQYGFDSLAFNFIERGVKFDWTCAAVVDLPEYEVARIETGRIVGGRGTVTHDSSGLIDLYRAAQRRVTSGEASVRSQFDVYAGEGGLTYVRESCGVEDVSRRFYLHVFPADAGVLSGWEAQRAYENRDFDFWEEGGVIFDGMCMVTVALPGYEVARVDTGQFSDSEGNVWSGGFAFGGE